jgi:hypoxanthine phosphoribosyltransferase
MLPKQDPIEKSLRAKHSDGKVYFSYAQIHRTICSLVPQVKEFNPDVIIAIGGGGFIPARMLRTEIKVPILAVSLELYDDTTKTANTIVKKTQWFDETSGVGKNVRNKR